MFQFKTLSYIFILLSLFSCGSTKIELKNDWVIHDNVEADFLLDYWNWEIKNRPKKIYLQEYYILSDSIVITKYNHNVPFSVRYTILNLYTFDRKEYIDKHLASDRTVFNMFKNIEFQEP